MGFPPVVTLNVESVTVNGSTASLNVALSFALAATSRAPSVGIVEVTVGGGVAVELTVGTVVS
jgi:hypothetical protein